MDIICSVCGCIFGGNQLEALQAGWVWKNGTWYCNKCKILLDEVV